MRVPSSGGIGVRLRAIVLSCLSLFHAAGGHADVAAASAARARGDYAAAVVEYRRLAVAGDPAAQASLGYMYHIGEGVEQDHVEAVRWYRQAADQGNADALYNLAVAYAFGEGVEQDHTEAVAWYVRAAELGHAVAQYSLGLSYNRGEGVERDTAEAAYWYARAAAQDYVKAQLMLAGLYYSGDGVPRDPAESARLYGLAAERGDPLGQYNLAGLYLSGTGVARNESEARRLYALSAEQGYVSAARRLAELDSGVASDPAAGRVNDAMQLRMDMDMPEETAPDDAVAAEQVPVDGGSPPAMLMTMDDTGSVGAPSSSSASSPGLPADQTPADSDSPPAMLMTTDNTGPVGAPSSSSASSPGLPQGATGVPVDLLMDGPAGAGDDRVPETASLPAAPEIMPAVLLEMPAGAATGLNFEKLERDHAAAMTALRDNRFAEAIRGFRDAAARGLPEAQYRLGTLHYQGIGTGLDYLQAALWYGRAARQGNIDAQFSLGNMYLLGEGLDRDDRQAIAWYRAAAAQGHEGARHNLDSLGRIYPDAAVAPAPGTEPPAATMKRQPRRDTRAASKGP